MTPLLVILAAVAGVVAGVVYSDMLLALYDDMRDLLRRLE